MKKSSLRNSSHPRMIAHRRKTNSNILKQNIVR